MIDEVIAQITNTDLSSDPFEHKFIKKIFPKNFYEKLIENLPNKEVYTPILGVLEEYGIHFVEKEVCYLGYNPDNVRG